VRDNGPGIDPAALPHIFEERFYARDSNKNAGGNALAVDGVCREGYNLASHQSADRVVNEMKTLTEIKDTLKKHQEVLRQRYKMRVVGIFGSYVRGEQKRGSDLDLLAEFEEPVSLLELVGAEIYLSEILKVKVDLIPKEDVRAELKERILGEAISL